MSLADIFDNYDFSDFYDYEYYDPGLESLPEYDSSTYGYFDPGFEAETPSSETLSFLYGGTSDDPYEKVGDLKDTRSYLKQGQDWLYDILGVDKDTAKLLGSFSKGAVQALGQDGQKQGVSSPSRGGSSVSSGRANQLSRAGNFAGGAQWAQQLINQSERAIQGSRALQQSLAKGSTFSNNDLAEMISGSTDPRGTKQKLPGTTLRQLSLPRASIS